MFILLPARPEDAAGIQEIHETLHRPLRPETRVEEYLVAHKEGSGLVGCAAVAMVPTEDGFAGYLYGLAVRKQCQRQGVGAALTLARVERIQQQQGHLAIGLAMFWNIGFFRKLGFETVKRGSLPKELVQWKDFSDHRYRHSAVISRRV